MMEPGLKTAAIFSILAHFLAFFTVAGLVRRPTSYPSLPYVVTLVAPSEPVTDTEKADQSITPAAVSAKVAEKVINTPSKEDFGVYSKASIKKIKEEKELKDYKDERIAAIGAKRALKQKAEGRRTVDIKGSAASGSQSAEYSVLDFYYGRVRDGIWAEWVFPSEGKGLEAVVSITIRKDGSVRINGIEKSSGNPLFDRSALKAINRASPLEPPPVEMDIGIKFYL